MRARCTAYAHTRTQHATTARIFTWLWRFSSSINFSPFATHAHELLGLRALAAGKVLGHSCLPPLWNPFVLKTCPERYLHSAGAIYMSPSACSTHIMPLLLTLLCLSSFSTKSPLYLNPLWATYPPPFPNYLVAACDLVPPTLFSPSPCRLHALTDVCMFLRFVQAGSCWHSLFSARLFILLCGGVH